ncbi:OB-fold protein [Massilia glaciei]|uniref:Uncharacterized protein n=1 Tax=Massilia glaciei TaxID=1524097 RepID=A0A2U2HEN6_9BURK|nr:hypothetical protein [Massilia glaciei]PWF42094.1 hypothetical protein C7C56_023315 [Massilia glaciei]
MKTSFICSGVVAIGVLAIVLVMLLTPPKKTADLALVDRVEQVAEQAIERQWMQALPAVTAHELALAYRANAESANKDFRGRPFMVSGMVVSINADAMGDPFITLRGGTSEFLQPQFGFDRSALRALSKLRSGVEVSLKCTGKGDVAKVPVADSCILLAVRERMSGSRRLSARSRDD